MSFFDSAVVRAEIAEITELQEEVYVNVFKFPSMTREEKIDHIDLLEKLLDKQRVLYTRLSLSVDPEAVEMRQKIVDSAILMGMPKNVDMNVILSNMKSVIEVMRKQLDTASSD
jgi:hypothetical protein